MLPERDRPFDPGALLIGVWFAVVGVLAMVAGADRTTDALPLFFPLTLVLVGVGMLLPVQRPRARPADDIDADDERPPEIPDEFFR